jgi:hypothetical protein
MSVLELWALFIVELRVYLAGAGNKTELLLAAFKAGELRPAAPSAQHAVFLNGVRNLCLALHSAPADAGLENCLRELLAVNDAWPPATAVWPPPPPQLPAKLPHDYKPYWLENDR